MTQSFFLISNFSSHAFIIKIYLASGKNFHATPVEQGKEWIFHSYPRSRGTGMTMQNPFLSLLNRDRNDHAYPQGQEYPFLSPLNRDRNGHSKKISYLNNPVVCLDNQLDCLNNQDCEVCEKFVALFGILVWPIFYLMH